MCTDRTTDIVDQKFMNPKPLFYQLFYILGIFQTVAVTDENNLILVFISPMVFSILSTKAARERFRPRIWRY